MSRKVLIIDDEPDIREVAQLSLELGRGWEVVAAGSGKEGLRLAAQENPDAILLDVMMPEMDGPRYSPGCWRNRGPRRSPSFS